MAGPQTISCSFSLLDEGRKYTGNHRKYLIENARDICYSDATREKIKLREAFGYYGHGRRVISGKMSLGEVEAVTLQMATPPLYQISRPISPLPLMSERMAKLPILRKY